MNYAEYLKTDPWAEVRQRAFEYAGHRCSLCKDSKDLQCHHNTYARVGAEEPSDLIVLCADCHKRHHHVLPESPKNVTQDTTPIERLKARIERSVDTAELELLKKRLAIYEDPNVNYEEMAKALMAIRGLR